MTLRDAIPAMLAEAGPLRWSDIHARLRGEYTAGAIHTAIRDLHLDGRIDRLSRGRYASAEPRRPVSHAVKVATLKQLAAIMSRDIGHVLHAVLEDISDGKPDDARPDENATPNFRSIAWKSDPDR